MAKEKSTTSAPGKVLVRFVVGYYGEAFGGIERIEAGEKREIDAELAERMKREYGEGCPFVVDAQNKAMSSAPETK
jgi:hypothetical protein